MKVLAGLAMALDGFVGYRLLQAGRWDLVLVAGAVLVLGLGAMVAGRISPLGG